MSQKNTFGLEIHPTDDLIHWREKDKIALAEKLRTAYQALTELGPAYAEHLKTLMDASRKSGYEDGYDDGAAST